MKPVGPSLLAALLFAGACASASTLDGEVIVGLIPAAVSPEVAADVTDVSCPDEIPREAGLIVRCTARLGADQVTVD
ncbi:MAG: DUF4333 domain-containing protein, partial [Acidimicrobiales bacterium]|nr:DUF4333 domain-containing protein [Acidimicrobiales bacterium]